MALRELPATFNRLVANNSRSASSSISRSCRRYASMTDAAARREVADDFQDLESQTSFSSDGVSPEKIQAFDPAKTAKQRKKELPPSRYQFRPPRYYRGPLHPHQPPPVSDPASRLFVPGPFSYTRLEQTYQSTIAPDLMALGYVHKPPGSVQTTKEDRLRTWDDSSPYHKGRPKRAPRGPGKTLRTIEKDIDWWNVPNITEITVHTMVKGAMDDSAHLHVAGIMLQAITGVRPTVHRVRRSDQIFGIRRAAPISLTSTMRGDQAYEFIDKCANLVLPRIKDWDGIKGTSGDSSGNIAFGIEKECTVLFPEVEINYDMYPPAMIPGFHVIVKTSATSDRHARLLLTAIGLPFKGKLVD